MPEAYCGPAPEPQLLLMAWNVDAVAIILCIGLAGIFYRIGDTTRMTSLILAILLILLLFISPLCALTVALFSARVAHHVLLVAVVAPLLALALPERPRAGKGLTLEWLVAIHALILWFWHVPQVYAVGIATAPAYWTMQLSLFGSGFLMWRRILSPRTHAGAAMLALLATLVQMGMLGALLTFAQSPLYAPHAATTYPYGLTPLEDQQLGGLIMWVPAALPYLFAALLLLAAHLGRTRVAQR